MSKKNVPVVAFIFIVLACSWFAFQKFSIRNVPGHPPKKIYQGKIIIGTEIWPGYLPLYVAGEKGYFKEAGLDVSIKLYKGFG